MKVVIVGCGAVGQVYGYHLREGGAEVVFLVRDYQVAKLRAAPLRLYRLSALAHDHSVLGLPSSRLLPRALTPAAEPRFFSDFRVFDLQAVAAAAAAAATGKSAPASGRAELAAVDVVLITIPSNRLRERNGAWLTDLIRHLEGIDPTRKGNIRVVGFSPAMNDLNFLMSKVSKDLLLRGSVNLMSYQAPLPGQKFEPIPQSAYLAQDGGVNPNPIVAYMAPSFQPISCVTPKSQAFADELCATFSAGRLGARRISLEVQCRTLAVVEMFVTPFLLALEVKGWDFRALAADCTTLRLLSSAMREAMQVRLHPGIAWVRYLLLSIHLYLFLKLLPLVCWPLVDIEAFVKFHFCKVGKQTVTLAVDFLEEGRSGRFPMESFQTLRHIADNRHS